MYGPASVDYVSAKMADHGRHARQVALENAARRSQRAERTTTRSWRAELVSFLVNLGRRYDLRKRTSAAPSLITLASPAVRVETQAKSSGQRQVEHGLAKAA